MVGWGVLMKAQSQTKSCTEMERWKKVLRRMFQMDITKSCDVCIWIPPCGNLYTSNYCTRLLHPLIADGDCDVCTFVIITSVACDIARS